MSNNHISVPAFTVTKSSPAEMWAELLQNLPDELKNTLHICTDVNDCKEQDTPCFAINRYGNYDLAIRGETGQFVAEAETLHETAHTAIFLSLKPVVTDDILDIACVRNNDVYKDVTDILVWSDVYDESYTHTFPITNANIKNAFNMED